MLEETEAQDGDVRLMLRFKEGDAQAFEILFSRHARAIVNFAYRFVRDRYLAEELAQEVFLKVFEAAAGYQPRARFTTWLYRIASNICLNELRKPRLRAKHEPLPAEPSASQGFEAGGGPDEIFQRRTVSLALREAIDTLPEKQRIAFILSKYQDLSYAEVAGIMGTSEKAVKSLIHRAREALAERLRPRMPEFLMR